MESTATWSVRRVAAPEAAPGANPLRRPRSPAAACWAVTAALVCGHLLGQLLLHCEAASHPVHPVAVSSSGSFLAALPPPPLPAPGALQARGKDDYDDYGDDDDYDDDYDYYGTKKKKKKKKKPAGGAQAAAVSPSETNVFNFVRIMVLRLVWGFASWLGFDEPLSEAFGGAFVPPGVDPDGDDGLGFDY